MRTIISKVDQMKAQRRTLEQDLREAVRRDDITTSLAQRGNKDTDKIFQTEIKKHEKTVEYIRQVSSCKFFLYEYIKIMGVGNVQSQTSTLRDSLAKKCVNNIILCLIGLYCFVLQHLPSM